MCNWLQIWIIKWRWKRKTMQIKCSFIAKALLFVCASKASHYTVHYLFLCTDFCSPFVFRSFRWGKKFNIWKWICHFRRSRFSHLQKNWDISRPALTCPAYKKKKKRKMQKPQFHCVLSLVLSLFHFINLNWKRKKAMPDNQIKDFKWNKTRHDAVQKSCCFLHFAMRSKRNTCFFILKEKKTLYNEQHDKTFSGRKNQRAQVS